MADAFDPFGNGGLSEGDATSLALLDAMSQIQKAGLQRTASPIGSIAQNLAPLFAAPIEGRRIQQRSAITDLIARAHMVNALAQMQNAINSGAGGEETPKTIEQAIVQRRMKDPNANIDDLTGAYTTMHPKEPKNDTEITLAQKVAAGDPQAKQVWNVLSQRDAVKAGTNANIQLDKQVKFETWKNQHPKLTQQQLNALDAGDNLIQMLDEVPAAVSSIPKDIDRASLAMNAGKYQARSEHPVATNLLTGITGGALSADSDPRLDDYFSTVGQTQAALTSFSLAGMRGGQRTIEYLKAHFPGWGDDAATVERKARFMASNKSTIRKKVEYLQGLLRQSAEAAQAVGGEPVGDMVRVKVRGPNGQETYMMINPATGESSYEGN